MRGITKRKEISFVRFAQFSFQKEKIATAYMLSGCPGLLDHPRLICQEGAYGTMSLRLFWYRNYNLL
jgi:hypothetical protein